MITTVQTALKPMLTSAERRKYSIAAALNASNPAGNRNCMEREISDSFCRQIRYNAGTAVVVPSEILFGDDLQRFRQQWASRRTLTVDVPSAGGYTVGEEMIPLMLYLHGRSKALGLGAQLVPGLLGMDIGGQVVLKGNVALPVESASDEAEWLSEGETASGGSSTFGQAIATPRRLYAQRTLSRQLLAQWDGGEQLLRRIIASSVGAALDRGVFAGTGGKQPNGILTTTGTTAISHGTDGGAPTLTLLGDAENVTFSANAPMVAPGYILSPGTREKMKRTQKATNTSSFLLETINGIDYVNGYRAFASTYLPDDYTKGSGSTLGSFVFGDWDSVFVALWGGLELDADWVTTARSGTVTMFANAFADTLHPRANLFAVSRDVVTT